MLNCIMEQKLHVPVMAKEVISYLRLKPGQTIVDATTGTAGHALLILERINPGGRLIAFDRDEESLVIARERLAEFNESCQFQHANFVDIDTVLSSLHIDKVDGVLLDLGISSFQLDNPERGFSFQAEGPLDMRLDRDSYVSAYDLVNNLSEEEISALLWDFGQERWHKRIARILVYERQKRPIATTRELSDLIVRAMPYKYRHSRIHPATRTFQAIRIVVNRELEALEKTMEKVFRILNKGSRICVISFHSLEDRIIKLSFRKFSQEGLIKIITPKPLTPDFAEIQANPSSRSAKLRVAERL